MPSARLGVKAALESKSESNQDVVRLVILFDVYALDATCNKGHNGGPLGLSFEPLDTSTTVIKLLHVNHTRSPAGT